MFRSFAAMAVDYRNASYDPGRDRAWHLSLWRAHQHSAWCVQDRATGHLMALQEGHGEQLPQQDLLPLHPASVSFVALPVLSTLVPDNLLAEGSEMDLLRTVHGQLPTGLLRDEPLPMAGARCIYLHDEEAEMRSMQRYPNARPLPLQGVLAQAAMLRSTRGPTVLLERNEKRLDIAVADRRRLLLSNTFVVTRAEDVLYYTLFALEQCGIAPGTTAVHTSGPALASDEAPLLRRYFASVAPWSTPAADGHIPNSEHWGALLEQFAMLG